MALRTLAIAAIILALIARPLYDQIIVLGFFRTPTQYGIRNPLTDVKKIDNVRYCEDVHYYAPGNVIFTSCEDDPDVRFLWFPAAGVLKMPAAAGVGSLKAIDVKTFKAKTLALEDYTAGTFTTHGIDVIADPTDKTGKTVLIYAVNHKPNPEYIRNLFHSKPDHNKNVPESKSQIEVFRYVLGSDKAKHIRSIQHDAIHTPNDIIADSPDSIYVTNDHYYRSGLMRYVEDFWKQAKWSYVYHIKVKDIGAAKTTAQDGIEVRVATPKLHNPNGMGRVSDVNGKPTGDILITSATSGQLYSAKVVDEPELDKNLTVNKIHQFDITIDNPSYFADPYAADGQDASGYILAGLTRAIDVANSFEKKEAPGPMRVYHLKKVTKETEKGMEETYERTLLFEDDSRLIRIATAATLVAIDPKTNDGKKEGWLWIASVLDPNVLAVKIDLENL
ncbi:hypothetical protein KEM54_000610 [Ascosphaera aggregata]|nr:hypothetical protein KEM54_000610 [Ascosphaera aggregata]